MPALRHTAEDVSLQLYDLVAGAADPISTVSTVQHQQHGVEATTMPLRTVSPVVSDSENAVRSRNSSVFQAVHPLDDAVSDIVDGEVVVVIDEPFNYEQAATAIMELFAKNVHEPTKISGMRWLLLLHRKAPWRILTPQDMSFPVLLKMLSDSSEQVVKLDLELFAQISLYSQHHHSTDDSSDFYLSRFLGSLLQMFATDRVLLETRAALMVRQLCLVLDPQLVFCLFARLLTRPRFSPDEDSEYESEEEEEEEEEEEVGEYEVDLEFISVMVQHLSWILVTAPETEGLRLLLREYNAELVQQMPLLPSIRDAVAKDNSQPLPLPPPQPPSLSSRVGRSRGASLSPSGETAVDAPPPSALTDSPQQKPTKIVRASTAVKTPSRATVTNKSSAAELDKPRATTARSSKPTTTAAAPHLSSSSTQQLRRRRQQHAELAALGIRGRNIL
ncbi:hypothetical protein GGI21_005429, partial [Coemansia aciculifera]